MRKQKSSTNFLFGVSAKHFREEVSTTVSQKHTTGSATFMSVHETQTRDIVIMIWSKPQSISTATPCSSRYVLSRVRTTVHHTIALGDHWTNGQQSYPIVSPNSATINMKIKKAMVQHRVDVQRLNFLYLLCVCTMLPIIVYRDLSCCLLYTNECVNVCCQLGNSSTERLVVFCHVL